MSATIQLEKHQKQKTLVKGLLFEAYRALDNIVRVKNSGINQTLCMKLMFDQSM